MSQSQHSDALSSSLYDSDFENLSYLTPEGHPLFAQTHNLPMSQASQRTFDSTVLEFLRPLIPLPIPSCLQRVGPSRNKAYILYDEMVDKEFMEWWIGTHCGKNRSIKWDSAHLSQAWYGFHQVAHSSDGAP